MLTCFSCAKGKEPKRDIKTGNSIPVKVLKVEDETYIQSLTLIGTIEAKREVTLTAEVSGKITYIYGDEGVKVSKGKLIIKIDDEDIKLQIMQHKAKLKEVEAHLADSRKNLDRYEKLYAAKNISKAALESEQLKVLVLEAQLTSAKANLEMLNKKSRDTKIISPFDGTIARLDIEVGEFIAAGTPVVTILDASEAEIEIGVPQLDIGYIEKGRPVEVYAHAYTYL
jgi:RND family efflux transporter MFP subunit